MMELLINVLPKHVIDCAHHISLLNKPFVGGWIAYVTNCIC